MPQAFQNPSVCGRFGQMCSTCPGGAVCNTGICMMPPPPPPPVDGGQVGNACLFDGQCQAGGSASLCIPPTVLGQATGWPQGYCSATCSSTGCPANASCVNVGGGGGGNDFLCLASCPAPRQGQSTCRANYRCEVNLAAFGSGICIPRCDSPGFNCWDNTTCDVASGYCVLGP